MGYNYKVGANQPTMTGICNQRGTDHDGYPLPHSYERKDMGIGDNGYPHCKFVCTYCGKVDAEFTAEEMEKQHVTDMIIGGEIVKGDLRDGSLDEDWIQEAFEKRARIEADN